MRFFKSQISSDQRYFGLTTIQAGIVAILGLLASLALCGVFYLMASTYKQLGLGPALPVSTAPVRSTSPPTWTPTPFSTDTVVPTLAPEPQLTEMPTSMPGERHFEMDGGFSYIPPSGWQVIEFPDIKYEVARGAPTGDFAPDLKFVDEAFSGSLDDYVTASLVTAKQFLEDANIVSQEDFATDEGKRSIKVVIESTQNGVDLYQAFYFFDAGAKKFIATYTRLTDKGQENDILVDQSMRTFRIEK